MGSYAFFPTSFRRQPPEVCCRGMLSGVSRDSREDACAGVSFLIKLLALGLRLCWRRDFGAGVFPVSFAGFLGGAFSTEHLRKNASVFYSNALKMDLATLISYWLLVSCVFWRYVSPRRRTAWCLSGIFYFVFIILKVHGAGRSFLYFIGRWKTFHFALSAGMLLPNMVINIFVGLQLFIFFVFFCFYYLFVEISYL